MHKKTLVKSLERFNRGFNTFKKQTFVSFFPLAALPAQVLWV